MKIHRADFFKLLFPLTIAVFLSQGNNFFGVFFNQSSRWLLVLLLFGYLLSKKQILTYHNPIFLLVFSSYLIWCLLTVFWSEVPLLSFLKGSLLVWTTISMVSAGLYWTERYSKKASIDWLWISVIVVFFSGITGKLDFSGNERQYYDAVSGNWQIYQGLYRSANMLGFVMAVTIPFLFWKLYENWSSVWSRFIYGILLFLFLLYLFESHSRSAFLILLSIIYCVVASFSVKRKFLVLIISFLFSLSVLTMLPSDIVVNNLLSYVYKTDKISDNSLAEQDAFKSRRDVWQDSYDTALEGGWFGGGYGVSIGSGGFDFSALSSSGYGREKGCSQLGIIEETGVVGLLLYALLIVVIFFQVYSVWYRSIGQEKVLIGVLLGILLGLLIQSGFEGWWGAPGSPEAMYFWSLVGIIMGFVKKKRRVAVEYSAMETSIGKIVTSKI